MKKIFTLLTLVTALVINAQEEETKKQFTVEGSLDVFFRLCIRYGKRSRFF